MGQPFKCHSGILRFPGRCVMSLGYIGVLTLLCVVAPPLVLGSPDIGERVEGEWGVRWDGPRGGQGFGVSAFPPAPGNSLWLQWERKVNWKMDRVSYWLGTAASLESF